MIRLQFSLFNPKYHEIIQISSKSSANSKLGATVTSNHDHVTSSSPATSASPRSLTTGVNTLLTSRYPQRLTPTYHLSAKLLLHKSFPGTEHAIQQPAKPPNIRRPLTGSTPSRRLIAKTTLSSKTTLTRSELTNCPFLGSSK